MKELFLIRYLYIENNNIKSTDKIANILCKMCIVLWKFKELGIRSSLHRGQLPQASAEPLFETIAPKIIVIKTTNKEFNNQKECIKEILLVNTMLNCADIIKTLIARNKRINAKERCKETDQEEFLSITVSPPNMLWNKTKKPIKIIFFLKYWFN